MVELLPASNYKLAARGRPGTDSRPKQLFLCIFIAQAAWHECVQSLADGIGKGVVLTSGLHILDD